jgi:hypothetical protein
VEPFINLGALTPRPGRLKCVWIPAADGRLECIWVPDWEQDQEHQERAVEAPEPVRRAS